MLSRSVVALTTVAALALPAAALAERGPGHGGRFATTVEAPVLAPEPATTDVQGDVTTTDAPAGGEDRPKNQHRRGGQDQGSAGLQRKVWRVSGEANGFDADRQALTIVVDEVGGLSKRLAARLQTVLGEQADVLVSARTRVVDADGRRLSAAETATALDAADSVKVTGKLAPRTAWAKDADGAPVPALRALRIKIVG